MDGKDEKDVKLEELAKKLSPEYLLKRYKVTVMQKIQQGELGLAGEIEKIKRLDDKLFNAETARDRDEARDEIEKELHEVQTGIPDRLKVKRPYNLSPEARRARQLNAQKSTGPRTAEGKAMSAKNGAAGNWIHGGNSKSLIRRTMGMCTSKCDKYPCTAVEAEETKKGELCLDHEGLPLKIKILVEAAESGNIDQAKKVNAALLALAQEQIERMWLDINEDGAMIMEPMFSKEGALLGHRFKSHPVLAHVYNAMAKLGFTLQDMRLTPKELQRTNDADKDRQSLADALASAGAALFKMNRKDDDGDDD